MCWAHARRKIIENIKTQVDKENQEEFEEDVDKLQVSPTTDIFERARDCFRKKWKKNSQR